MLEVDGVYFLDGNFLVLDCSNFIVESLVGPGLYFGVLIIAKLCVFVAVFCEFGEAVYEDLDDFTEEFVVLVCEDSCLYIGDNSYKIVC